MCHPVLFRTKKVTPSSVNTLPSASWVVPMPYDMHHCISKGLCRGVRRIFVGSSCLAYTNSGFSNPSPYRPISASVGWSVRMLVHCPPVPTRTDYPTKTVNHTLSTAFLAHNKVMPESAGFWTFCYVLLSIIEGEGFCGQMWRVKILSINWVHTEQ